MRDRETDRRQSRRRSLVEDHGILSAYIRPRHHVVLIDISAGGALVEATHRLLPGRCVELHVETAEGRLTLRGRLLRCTVTHLQSSAVRYRAAIVFGDRLRWPSDDPADAADATAVNRPQPSFTHKQA